LPKIKVRRGEMDVEKLYKTVMLSEEVKDVPIIYIMTVLNCVLDVIGSGDCFYKLEDD
jgi:hypothetical protein